MKKFLAALLMTILCMSACAAFADTAEFTTTADFLRMLDDAEMVYTNYGIDQDGDEHVSVKVREDFTDYTIHYYFEADQEHTAIFVWNIIEFDAADTLKVMHVCNTLNYEYNYTCFYVDTTDNTVTCSMNLIYRDENVGLVTTEATVYLMSIMEEAWPSLEFYAK